MKIPFKIDLQLFNDIWGDPSNNPINAEVTEAPAQGGEVPGEAVQIPGEATEIPGEAPAQGNEFDMKNYVETMFSQISSKLDDMNKTQATEQVFEEVAQEKEYTPEEIEALKEDFLNKLYENPLELMKELEEKALNKAMEAVKPIQERYELEQKNIEMDRTLKEFANNNPDIADYAGDMANYLTQNPHIAELPNALELAYKVAKADKLSQVQAPASFEDMLKDPNNIEKLLGNEEVKKVILNNHMKNVTTNKAPTTIGGGGTTTINVPNAPKSLREATNAWKGTW